MKYSVGELLEVKRDIIISTFTYDHKNDNGEEKAKKGQLYLVLDYINKTKLVPKYYDSGYVLYSQVDGSLSFWSDYYTEEVEDNLDELECSDILTDSFERCFKNN
jgi:hypothetical protein